MSAEEGHSARELEKTPRRHRPAGRQRGPEFGKGVVWAVLGPTQEGVFLPVPPSGDSKARFSQWTSELPRPVALTPNFSDHEEPGPPAHCEADRYHRRGAHLDHNGTVFLWGGEREVAVGEPCDGGWAAVEWGGMRLEGGALNSQLPVFCVQLKQPRDHL